MRYGFFGLLGFTFLGCLILVILYVSNANYGNSQEVLIKATYQNNENILAQYGQKVAEVAEVPDMYRDDVQKVTVAALSGRYGSEGSKAVIQVLREQNPQLDPKLYLQIQEVMEAGRNDFQGAQTKLIDIRRQYQAELGYVWSGYWLRVAGYPRINLDRDYQPIMTSRAAEIFKTGAESGPIKLR